MSGDPQDVLDYDEEEPDGMKRFWQWQWEFVRAWGPAILAVLLIRSAIAEPFRIPSGSMVPTLEIGDHILVSKFAYGLRVPGTQMELLPLGEPERGDVIVFKYPPNERLDYIKRIVGLPGDVIDVRDNTLYVNDVKAEKTFQDSYEFVNDSCRSEQTRLFEEDLMGVPHAMLTSTSYAPRLSDFGPFTVPADSYFVMGDNRDNSADSRVWGRVPRENIKGKAVLVWLSYDACSGNIPIVGDFRMGRFFTGIR